MAVVVNVIVVVVTKLPPFKLRVFSAGKRFIFCGPHSAPATSPMSQDVLLMFINSQAVNHPFHLF